MFSHHINTHKSVLGTVYHALVRYLEKKKDSPNPSPTVFLYLRPLFRSLHIYRSTFLRLSALVLVGLRGISIILYLVHRLKNWLLSASPFYGCQRTLETLNCAPSLSRFCFGGFNLPEQKPMDISVMLSTLIHSHSRT